MLIDAPYLRENGLLFEHLFDLQVKPGPHTLSLAAGLHDSPSSLKE